MPLPYKPYIAQTPSELMDLLGMMMLRSPTFQDKMGYFPERNIDTVFYQLNESLSVQRGKLGEERYLQLRSISDKMRAHFEADPEDKTDDSIKGRELILEMEDLLIPGRRIS